MDHVALSATLRLGVSYSRRYMQLLWSEDCNVFCLYEPLHLCSCRSGNNGLPLLGSLRYLSGHMIFVVVIVVVIVVAVVVLVHICYLNIWLK